MNNQPAIFSYPTYLDACTTVAGLLLSKIQKNPSLCLALPTGRSAIELYAQFTNQCLSTTPFLKLDSIHTFNLDEYVGIKPESPDSFHSFMSKHLFSKVKLSATQIHFPNPQSPHEYESEIEKCGGLDLCILGLGLNGHIAFNEPNSKRDSKTRIVELNAETKIANQDQFSDASTVPSHAVTMGLSTILSSKEIFLLCNTREKWKKLSPYLQKNEIDPLFPASYLLEHPRVSIFHI